MKDEIAPNYREIPKHKSCSNCYAYDLDYGFCEKYGFDVIASDERICDGWVEP